MNAESLLEKYYAKSSALLIEHSRAVASKAVKVAEKCQLNDIYINFIYEASLLHDIGIFKTNAPSIGCHGDHHYITHGIWGRRVLESEGFAKYGMVCERHIGTGLKASAIKRDKLPLPVRNMTPLTLAEEIVTYSDLFFSKSAEYIDKEKSCEEVREGLKRFGEEGVAVFDNWHSRFAF